MPRFSAENRAANRALVELLGRFAAERGATPAQIALAWLLAQGSDIAPIPGTKRLKYLEENAEAVSVSLSHDDLAKLEALATQTSGPRYGESGMKMVER